MKCLECGEAEIETLRTFKSEIVKGCKPCHLYYLYVGNPPVLDAYSHRDRVLGWEWMPKGTLLILREEPCSVTSA